MPRITAAQQRQDAMETAGDYPVHRPSLVLPDGLDVPVAVDTETNHLFGDDGSRVAVLSCSWIPPEIVQDEAALMRAIQTGAGVIDYAFPFDQGVRDKILTGSHKRRYNPGQMDLFAQDDINLDQGEWEWLISWLAAQPELDYHNAYFDLEKIRLGTRHWPGIDLLHNFGWDTQLACKEIWPLESTSLKPTGGRLWGEDEQAEAKALKPWLGPKTDPRYDLVPWHVIGPYAAKDTNLTIRLRWLQKILVAEGICPPEWIRESFEYMKVLYLMTARGMPYQVGRSLEVAVELDAELERIAATLPFKPEVNAAKRYYFGPKSEGGLELVPYGLTDKGDPSLDEDVMRRMEAGGAPHAATYARWRKIDNAVSNWYRGWPELAGDDGRLRGYFRQTHVRSGRLSIERFQAQAIPHSGKLKAIPEHLPRPRELFDFRNGWEVDLAQAELRVAAMKARCLSMIELIEAGEDLHGITAELLFNVRSSDPDWFDLRQVAKRGNFSFIFGVGWKTFMNDLRKQTGIEITESKSKEIVYKWKRQYPEFGRAIDQFADFAIRHRYVPLANGKRRWFQGYELQYGAHQAFNQYVQPSLAELAKDWTIDTEARHPGLLVMTVHDSQYLDMPADWSEDKSKRIAADIAQRAGELGTEMFGIEMTADYGKWGEH